MPVSEEMAHRCVLLAQELLRWPDVHVRSMFGLRAFYRGSVVFAMLPDKRALESSEAISYKLAGGAEKHEGEKWRRFDVKSDRDIDNALARLDQAYSRASVGGASRLGD